MSPFQAPEGPYTIEGIMESIQRQVIDQPGTDPAAQAASDAPAGAADAEEPALGEHSGDTIRVEPAAIPRAAHGEFQPVRTLPLVVDGSPNARLRAEVELLSRRQSTDPGYRIRSHRPLIGRFFDSIKRVVHWAERPYIDAIRARQEIFNETTAEALREIALRLDTVPGDASRLLHEAAARHEALAARHEALAARHEALTASEAALAERVSAMHERQEQLERELEAARQAFTALGERTGNLESGIEHQGASLAELRARHDLGPFYASVPGEQRLAALDRTRGNFEDISNRQRVYPPLFAGAPGPVLELGCGRGELLTLLKAQGTAARGIESDPLMVEQCRARGLEVEVLDALSALRAAAPGSLGGVFAAQVVEHFFPGDLLALLKLTLDRLAPGGRVIFETLNPAALAVIGKSYYRDLDHKQMIHPEYLKLLLELAGFEHVELHLLAPFSAEERIPELPAELPGLSPEARDALQERLARLNEAVFGMQDYYVVGAAPQSGASAG